MKTYTIRFDQLPPQIQKAYGDGSTVHEVKAWDDERGAGFKVIRCDGVFTNWTYSRTCGWVQSLR